MKRIRRTLSVLVALLIGGSVHPAVSAAPPAGSISGQLAYTFETKMPMARADLWNPGYAVNAGSIENGIHAMPSRNGRLVNWRVGVRGSFGCVALNIPDAAKLYCRTPLGTLAVVRPG
ncbi:MAG: hypothetical protein KatS3mg052_2156 [Candidatus Roseilinea sp.]|nr:MAG: hypothetical protein KatS3mg052_2156 [Candidatus Roseilinea sp.]